MDKGRGGAPFYSPRALYFMAAACEHTDLYRALAEAIAPRLPPNSHVLDAGCGLGYLSSALLSLPQAARVTAVDREAAAIKALQARCRGVEAILGDVFALPPRRSYDALVCCAFARAPEALSLAKAQCGEQGLAVLIKRGESRRRFSLTEEQPRPNGAGLARDWLEARGIPFAWESLRLEMGQPFLSLEEALDFFALYAGGRRPPDRALVEARLTADPKGLYPLYFPAPYPAEIFYIPMEAIHAADL